MPFWLMFVPLVAIARAIATVFVAFGQWITGNYFTLVPVDGDTPGHIEYIEPSTDAPEARIRISLSDGRTFIASLDSRESRTPIEILAADPVDDTVASYGHALALRATGESGGWMDCRFTFDRRDAPQAGRCVSDRGRSYDIVRQEPRSGRRKLLGNG